MRLSAILGIALRRLRQRPVRTLLLLQGTVWGVAVAVGAWELSSGAYWDQPSMLAWIAVSLVVAAAVPFWALAVFRPSGGVPDGRE